MMTDVDDQLTTIEVMSEKLLEEQQARAELERELHLIHNFIRRAGHDLKTPITTLKTSLYLLQRKPELAVEERLQMMETQLDRLSHLVDAMGMMARLEHQQALEINETDVCVIIHEAVRVIANNAQAHQIAIVQDLMQDIPPLALNFEEMKRALVNLLDNAIRYSPDAGAVFIRVFEMHGYLCVDITDTGQGLSEHDVDHLFERFYRGDEASQLHVEGAGMGLPIVRRIVELHGGKMRVMTEQGEGSTFRIMLPFEA